MLQPDQDAPQAHDSHHPVAHMLIRAISLPCCCLSRSHDEPICVCSVQLMRSLHAVIQVSRSRCKISIRRASLQGVTKTKGVCAHEVIVCKDFPVALEAVVAGGHVPQPCIHDAGSCHVLQLVIPKLIL